MRSIHSADPTVPFMILEIVRETLAASNDTHNMQVVLTTQIREITGAKCVVLLEFISDKYNYRMGYVNPARFNSIFTDTLTTMLIDAWYEIDGITQINQNESSDGISDFLNEHRFQKNLICPLIAGEKKAGILFIFGLPEDNIHTQSIRRILSVLLNTVAFILENSKMRLYLEKIIKERTRELRKALIEAETANKAKSNFLANMSHEIRTPLNAILGFTDILKNMETDKHKSRFVDYINTSGHSLLNLINDILDLSKIESGKMNLEYTATSLTSMCTEMETLFSLKVQAKGLSLVVTLADTIPERLLIDETRLRQILINLLSNALKFTHSGSIALSIVGNYADSSGSGRVNLTVTVTDTGIGIPEDQLGKIFGTFEQVSGQDTKQYGGTGLGLAITKRIVEMMGGEISVVSEIGVGTEFSLVIPDIEIASGISDEAPNGKIHTNTLVFDPATILIVDDIDYNREILALFLSDWGFTLNFARNGEEAIECANRIHPDLILLDMKMPIMDGYQASAILKKSDTTCDIPIVAITASALKQDQDFIMQLTDGYLPKPVNRNDLVSSIMQFLPCHTDNTKPTLIEDKHQSISREKVILSLSDQPSEWLESFTNGTNQLDVALVKSLIVQLPDQRVVSFLLDYLSKYDFKLLGNLFSEAIEEDAEWR